MNIEETGIHMHCFTCYKPSSCNWLTHCEIVNCPNQCGLKYHVCKHDEHVTVCTRAKRACINQHFGCPFTVDSISLMKHLEYCPASVIHCGMSWNRYPLYSKIREEWLPFWQANPLLVKGDLDTEFAISDQHRVNQEMKSRMRKGHKMMLGKKVVSRLPCERMEMLLRAMKGLHTDSNKTNCLLTTTRNVDSKTSGDVSESRLNESTAFITYDDVHIRLMMDVSGFVSNTNIRRGFYELPYKFQSLKYHNFDIINDDDSTGNGMTSLQIEISQEDIEMRNKTYSELDRIYIPLGLNVVVETMPKFQNQYPMYSFSCSKVFRRDQFPWHFKNIHEDIQPHINGWVFQRCPLSQYGCPFSQYKLKPENLKLRFLSDFSSFCGNYENCSEVLSDNTGIGLFDLPEEVLYYLFTFMDSLTFNALAKTCVLVRNICYSFLDQRGIVLTTWTKRNYNELGSSWKEHGQIRLFTSSCAPMGRLTFTKSPSIGNHLKDCPFNTTNNELYKRTKVSLLPEEALEQIRKRRK